MCKPKPSVLAEYRDNLEDLLRQHIDDCNVIIQLIADIQVLSEQYYAGETKTKRRGTLESMVAGLNRVETVKSRCMARFGVNYLWYRKEESQILEWLCARPKEETIDKFADWWETKDWRGKQRQPPTLTQIYQFWPRAFMEEQEVGIQPGLFQLDE